MILQKAIMEAIDSYGDYPEARKAIYLIAEAAKKEKVGYMCSDHGFVPYDELDPCDIPF